MLSTVVIVVVVIVRTVGLTVCLSTRVTVVWFGRYYAVPGSRWPLKTESLHRTRKTLFDMPCDL